MAFDIEKEIVTANRAYSADYWEGYHAAAVRNEFNANRSQAWTEGYRRGRSRRHDLTFPRPYVEADTRAEDERLDSPIHEPGSLP